MNALAFLLICCPIYSPSQKRLEQKAGSVTATPAGTPATPAATPKVIVGSLSGQGTPNTKVVLSTKMGNPVTFQQNKNFQQSFATWVKQGQSTQGTLQLNCWWCVCFCSQMLITQQDRFSLFFTANHVIRLIIVILILKFTVATIFVWLFASLGAGTETTVATSGGHTFQITGTSVGGKVVTTKLPLPANSKIVTVNVPTSQGGTAGFYNSHLGGLRRARLKFIQCHLSFHNHFRMHVLLFSFLHLRPTPETFKMCQIRCGSLIRCHTHNAVEGPSLSSFVFKCRCQLKHAQIFETLRITLCFVCDCNCQLAKYTGRHF